MKVAGDTLLAEVAATQAADEDDTGATVTVVAMVTLGLTQVLTPVEAGLTGLPLLVVLLQSPHVTALVVVDEEAVEVGAADLDVDFSQSAQSKLDVDEDVVFGSLDFVCEASQSAQSKLEVDELVVLGSVDFVVEASQSAQSKLDVVAEVVVAGSTGFVLVDDLDDSQSAQSKLDVEVGSTGASVVVVQSPQVTEAEDSLVLELLLVVLSQRPQVVLEDEDGVVTGLPAGLLVVGWTYGVVERVVAEEVEGVVLVLVGCGEPKEWV